MVEHSIWADALNKFSQLTPWVQVSLTFAASITFLGLAYILKEMVVSVAAGKRHRCGYPSVGPAEEADASRPRTTDSA